MFSLNWFFGLIPNWVPWLIIFISITLYIISVFFTVIIPIVYRIPARLLAILMFAFGFYIDGRIDVLVDAKKEVEEAKANQVVVTKYVVKDYKEKRKKINDDYAKITSSISTKDDHLCTLPKSFVSVFDDSAKGTVSSTPERPDGTSSRVENSSSDKIEKSNSTASGVELSTAEKTIVENYELYHKVSEQLKALQKWIKDQQDLNP